MKIWFHSILVVFALSCQAAPTTPPRGDRRGRPHTVAQSSFGDWNDVITNRRNPVRKHRTPGQSLAHDVKNAMQPNSKAPVRKGGVAIPSEDLKQVEEDERVANTFHPGPISSMTIRKGDVLGKGSFGKVYLASTKEGEKVAVKEIDYSYISYADNVDENDVLLTIEKEAEICGTMDHINLLKCARDYEVATEKGVAYLVFEYCDAGDLFTLSERRSVTVKEAQCGFYQMIQGLHHLHQHNIAHADIKPENIMIQKSGLVKIGDFGLSKLVDPNGKVQSCDGTEAYQSPEKLIACGKYQEYLEKKKQNIWTPTFWTYHDPFAADVWAMGVTYLFSRLYRTPWEVADRKFDKGFKRFEENGSNYLDKMAEDSSLPPQDRFATEEMEVILGMLKLDPKNRMTLPEIKANSWYQSLINQCAPKVQQLLA